jgi:hypothetical protein
MSKFKVGDIVLDISNERTGKVTTIKEKGSTYPIVVDFPTISGKSDQYTFTNEGRRYEWDERVSLIALGRSEPPVKEPTFPRVMWVSSTPSIEGALKRVVLAQYNDQYIAVNGKQELTDLANGKNLPGLRFWNYAYEVEPEPQFVELTFQDISEGKGVGIDPALIRIKK